MNVRHRWLGLLACAALQACTTPPPPAPASPPPPPVAVAPPPMSAVPQPVPATAPVAATPVPVGVAPASAPTPVAQVQPEPVVDVRTLCDGRNEGERVQARGPGGEMLAGVCVRGANGWLRLSTNGRR
ncbi:hypothetical protein WKW79_11880 [Variovorax robiniae]|uniref:SH3 domain-containing protein n=1 Tax=Variovorax robiniae TaxID=1836199 RepID=A0ABU8X849_9BURK